MNSVRRTRTMQQSPYTLRSYRSTDKGHTNVHVGYLLPDSNVAGVYAIDIPQHLREQTNRDTQCFQIYPGGNDSKTFFEQFPSRMQLHALYVSDNDADNNNNIVRHLAHIASHDQYIYFHMPPSARTVYVTFAPTVKIAVDKIKP